MTPAHAPLAPTGRLRLASINARDGWPITRAAERFNRTLMAEWAYADTYDSETARARRYPGWLHDYNHHRPHQAPGGQTPAQVVRNLTEHNS